MDQISKQSSKYIIRIILMTINNAAESGVNGAAITSGQNFRGNINSAQIYLAENEAIWLFIELK